MHFAESHGWPILAQPAQQVIGPAHLTIHRLGALFGLARHMVYGTAIEPDIGHINSQIQHDSTLFSQTLNVRSTQHAVLKACSKSRRGWAASGLGDGLQGAALYTSGSHGWSDGEALQRRKPSESANARKAVICADLPLVVPTAVQKL
ncbi:MAG: hypothetical protein Q4A97_10310 [Comamonadaceae bacterium]|nr:hypothetical protein [Comamonadaceae bacterium]